MRNDLSVKTGKMSGFISPGVSLITNIVKNPVLYLMILPGVIYYIIFNYIPMYGIVIAFQDFSPVKGLFSSDWIGLKNFNDLFQSSQFYIVFKNSVILSIYRLLWGFPAPIILAIILNEVKSIRFTRFTQTIIYLPHFISWVVICGMVTSLLSPSLEGPVNYVIRLFGGESINFLIEPKYFRTVVICSEIWKEAGWGTIIYLAAITGIDPVLYEASKIDGANRLRQILHITLPGILSTVIVLFILRTGHILSNGFEQIFLLQNSLTYNVSDVFETFAYRAGLLERRYGFTTAIGLFQSLVGMCLIFTTNYFSKKVNDSGLW